MGAASAVAFQPGSLYPAKVAVAIKLQPVGAQAAVISSVSVSGNQRVDERPSAAMSASQPGRSFSPATSIRR
jgi:outer membrane protein assembly factor BamA